MTEPDAGARYFMRDGYVPNAARSATPDANYWNARRIEASALFQYRVYERAGALLRRTRQARVLDIGCGTALKAAELLIPRCAHYVGIDQPSAVEFCRANIKAGNAEFRADDLEAPSTRFETPFDLVVCADVIEHVAAPDALVAFAARALAVDGRLVLSTPEREIMHGAASLRPQNPDHVREWDRAELRQYLTSRGLRVLSLRLAPQFRLSLSNAGRRLLRGQLGRPLAYWGCQIAICARG